MRNNSTAIALLLVFFSAPLLAVEAPIIGRVKTVEGTVFLHRGDARAAVALNTELFEGDVLATGVDGAVGFTLIDETRLSLGPDAELEIASYLYEPAAAEGSILTRLGKGTMVFVSGLIAKLSPDAAKVETPVGTLGIRGTRFLVVVEAAP